MKIKLTEEQIQKYMGQPVIFNQDCSFENKYARERTFIESVWKACGEATGKSELNYKDIIKDFNTGEYIVTVEVQQISMRSGLK